MAVLGDIVEIMLTYEFMSALTWHELVRVCIIYTTDQPMQNVWETSIFHNKKIGRSFRNHGEFHFLQTTQR